MRRYHRWLAVFFGLFLLWISATGLLSHGAALSSDAQPAPAAAAPTGFICPDTMTCRPKRPADGPGAWVGFFHHLHSGEEFGPLGTALSILSGFALLFFTVSGLYMYLQMSRARGRSGRPVRGGKWFWR